MSRVGGSPNFFERSKASCLLRPPTTHQRPPCGLARARIGPGFGWLWQVCAAAPSHPKHKGRRLSSKRYKILKSHHQRRRRREIRAAAAAAAAAVCDHTARSPHFFLLFVGLLFFFSHMNAHSHTHMHPPLFQRSQNPFSITFEPITQSALQSVASATATGSASASSSVKQ